eukprot:GCRY01001099.1.p1 GENE.GCRY01001099.1~~GCRY01001099.1.p1  ORF type:complete len:189 (-),score=24.71 GCRY01001099.1:34-600(-)
MSSGKLETEKLREHAEEQLNRLMNQLQDIEELRTELDDDEYTETLNETMDQLKEFQHSLDKMVHGDMTLVSALGSMRLALQAAISEAFKTPEVIRMFAKGSLDQLRSRLSCIQREFKLGNLPKDSFIQQSLEILTALKKLGSDLTPEENEFIERNMTKTFAQFQQVQVDHIGSSILNEAGNQVTQAQQ